MAACPCHSCHCHAGKETNPFLWKLICASFSDCHLVLSYPDFLPRISSTCRRHLRHLQGDALFNSIFPNPALIQQQWWTASCNWSGRKTKSPALAKETTAIEDCLIYCTWTEFMTAPTVERSCFPVILLSPQFNYYAHFSDESSAESQTVFQRVVWPSAGTLLCRTLLYLLGTKQIPSLALKRVRT